jgi:hypothetical protein
MTNRTFCSKYWRRILFAKKDFPSPVGAKMAKFLALMRFFFSSQTSLSTGMLCCLSLKMTPVASD